MTKKMNNFDDFVENNFNHVKTHLTSDDFLATMDSRRGNANIQQERDGYSVNCLMVNGEINEHFYEDWEIDKAIIHFLEICWASPV